MQIAPNSDKGALLTAKAALLSGDVYTAHQVLTGHQGGEFENSDSQEFREVDALWKRATSALEDLEKAGKLEAIDGKEVEAAQLVHQASTAYPELPGMSLIVDQYDSGVDFAKKDYDAYLALSEKDWKMWPGSATAAMLASAIACKYAVTGDANLRQRAEEMIAKAMELANGDKELILCIVKPLDTCRSLYNNLLQ